MLYYHGSINSLPIGLELKPNKKGYVQLNKLETLFEQYKPNHCLSRFESVFLCSNPEDIDYCGGFNDFIYQVNSNETPQKSDLAWYTQAQFFLEENNLLDAIVAVKNYWSGKQYYPAEQSVYEYRVKSAVILKEYLD